MKKKLFSFVIILALILSMSVSAFADSTASTAKNGVAVLATYADLDGENISLGHGTCFFIGKSNAAPKYLLTNYHVVEDYVAMGKGDRVVMEFVDNAAGTSASAELKLYARVYYDSQDYDEAYLVDYDAQQDVALLRLEKPTEKRNALPLQVADDSFVGDNVYAIGYPAKSDSYYDDPKSTWGINDSLTTSGTVGRLLTRSGDGTQWIQISNTDWSSGNSGGPVVTDKGAVIGIATKVYLDDLSNMCNAADIGAVVHMLDKNVIEYWIIGNGLPMWVYIVAAAVVAVLIVLIIMLSRKGKKNTKVKNTGKKVNKGPEIQEVKETIATVRSLAAQHGGARVRVTGKALMIGRDPTCNIVFKKDTPGVSGVHCSISYDAASGDFILTDLKSSYGTFLATGQKLSANVPHRLRRGDSFYLAERSNLFQLDVE